MTMTDTELPLATDPHVLNVGDVVRYSNRDYTLVSRNDDGDWTVHSHFSGAETVLYGDTFRGGFITLVSPATDAPEAEEVHVACEATATELRERIARLETQVTSWRTDWNLLASSLVEEAENRDWCGEYESFVDRMNSQLRNGELIPRNRDIEVTATFSVTISTTLSAANGSEEDEIGAWLDGISPNDFGYHNVDDWEVTNTNWEEG
jgi:hypothetical protein